MINKHIQLIGAICIMLVTAACLKEDISKISHHYQWKPTLSLPLKSITFNAENYNGSTPILDTMSTPVFSESVEFIFPEIYTTSEYVDSMMLRLEIKNNFPARIKVYAYFMNQEGSIIESILTDSIPKPAISADGFVTQAEKLLYDKTFSKEDIPALEQTTSILLRVLIKDLEYRPEVLDKLNEGSIDVTIGLRSAVNVPIDEI
ncbi:hypothetical protein SAMN06265379_103190 [Saccharicrinis carchari]|uniref:Uncharacterized protein n=1 Tax=Saccharicrinis carchari TaxID=1168039 RepID=A0A521CJ36_SACCC|nr:hypothetical protein [Saccharicrinis carchari]SMO59395.1 hypothetical protein SAMN06265379_103190 [Saccharicrinis carchari]